MSENTNAENAVSGATATDGKIPSVKKNKKWPIVTGVVVAVLVVAGAGMWVWHEQPSFCGAICHYPMAAYNATYDQEPNTTGVDKYGNEVSNTSSMLCVTHKVSTEEGGAGATCLSCHVPTLSEQISEGLGWVAGDYVYPLYERTSDELTEARGAEGDEFCLNESCHNLTRDDLAELTSDMTRNPHVAQHGEVACTECHKAHRASVMYCSECHTDAEIPDGWLSYEEAEELPYT